MADKADMPAAMELAAAVRNNLSQKGITPDAMQEQALVTLSRLALPPHPQGRLKSLFAKPQKQSVYLWGRPGRGKTVLMDAFYREVEALKRRIHFHEFLRDMHQRMARLSGNRQRFVTATREFCEDIRLLCFDEFHVHDIADSVFIGKVLEALIEHGVMIVATSNYAPQHLMPDPVSHERFKPTIALIDRYFDIVHLDDGKDYRKQRVADDSCFYSPLGDQTDKTLRQLFMALEPQAPVEVCHVEIANRWIECRAIGERTAWIEFDALCKANRSYVDYLDLAKSYETLILSSMTGASLTNPNTVKRFLWLVDVMYDKRRNLVLSSEQHYEEMLKQASGIDDLDRTLSRLHEMSRSFVSPLV